jgi:hypothetical protein
MPELRSRLAAFALFRQSCDLVPAYVGCSKAITLRVMGLN